MRTTFLQVLILLLDWIKKRSSRGRLLEHLESSGTKIMTSGSMVRQLCEANKSRETERFLEVEFHVVLHKVTFFFAAGLLP